MEQPTITWPKGKRCAFSISFDLDGESPWIHRDAGLAERPLHMSMGAYGPRTGAPRILRVLDRYGIKAGWFVPGWIVERGDGVELASRRRLHQPSTHQRDHPVGRRDGLRQDADLIGGITWTFDVPLTAPQPLGHDRRLAQPIGQRARNDDRQDHRLHLFERTDHGKYKAPVAVSDSMRSLSTSSKRSALTAAAGSTTINSKRWRIPPAQGPALAADSLLPTPCPP